MTQVVTGLELGLVQQVLDAAPDAMLCVGPDGVIVSANARTEAMFGYGPGLLGGCRVEQLVLPRQRAAHVGHRGAYASVTPTHDDGRRESGRRGLLVTSRLTDGAADRSGAEDVGQPLSEQPQQWSVHFSGSGRAASSIDGPARRLTAAKTGYGRGHDGEDP